MKGYLQGQGKERGSDANRALKLDLAASMVAQSDPEAAFARLSRRPCLSLSVCILHRYLLFFVFDLP